MVDRRTGPAPGVYRDKPDVPALPVPTPEKCRTIPLELPADMSN
jgi:hypothetical protein